MNRSIKLVAAAFAASSMLLVTLGLTAARAQDADESGAPNTSTVVQVTGTWTGTDTEGGGSPGPMMLILTQNGKSIHGNFSLTTDNETPAGNVHGKISKDNLKLTFVATSGTSHTCDAKVLVTVDPTAMPPTMMGTFKVIRNNKHCKGSGDFNLTQQ
jgi:hypothetical protein